MWRHNSWLGKGKCWSQTFGMHPRPLALIHIKTFKLSKEYLSLFHHIRGMKWRILHPFILQKPLYCCKTRDFQKNDLKNIYIYASTTHVHAMSFQSAYALQHSHDAQILMRLKSISLVFSRTCQRVIACQVWLNHSNKLSLPPMFMQVYI